MGRLAGDSDTSFIKWIKYAFGKIGNGICYAPWTCIILSLIITGFMSLKIPLTEMDDNINYYTSYEARSRRELKVLDKISRAFYLRTSKGVKNFEQFCERFCTLNEQLRYFYSAVLISNKYANGSGQVDLGYPVTTVLGTKLFMDPNLFGVKVAVKGDNGQELVVSTADRKYKGSLQYFIHCLVRISQISITTITNVLAFGVGAFTPTPEIRLFSTGNALAVAVDFIFQITIYAALMVVVGRYEIKMEMNENPAICGQIPSERSSVTIEEPPKRSRYVSITGTINIRAELTPDKLFLADSDLVKIFKARNQYITTYYSVCWILVKNPGDVMNATNSKRIHQLVMDFEALPNSVGSFSTKFWLRDYEDFHEQGEEFDNPSESEQMIDFAGQSSKNDSFFPAVTTQEDIELKQFLEWPEFSFWKGFLQVEQGRIGNQYKVSRFFFTTAFHGEELTEWSNRAALLNQWRALADNVRLFVTF
ncbi:patched family protein [Teladorsagia circumcincta]|uniref:Patched family protein n=1 Tax=Teladorsagia circumcincta TaxID=45464 RepID=A0A2G9UA64_TELCI|nr:patched family protein [Teladorsagia circumcincta]